MVDASQNFQNIWPEIVPGITTPRSEIVNSPPENKSPSPDSTQCSPVSELAFLGYSQSW